MVTGKKCSSAVKAGKSMQYQAKLSVIETLMSLDSRARPRKWLQEALLLGSALSVTESLLSLSFGLILSDFVRTYQA
jgi:hypothetical protein